MINKDINATRVYCSNIMVGHTKWRAKCCHQVWCDGVGVIMSHQDPYKIFVPNCWPSGHKRTFYLIGFYPRLRAHRSADRQQLDIFLWSLHVVIVWDCYWRPGTTIFRNVYVKVIVNQKPPQHKNSSLYGIINEALLRLNGENDNIDIEHTCRWWFVLDMVNIEKMSFGIYIFACSHFLLLLFARRTI